MPLWAELLSGPFQNSNLFEEAAGEYVGFSMNAGAHAGDLFQPGEIDAVEESWDFN